MDRRRFNLLCTGLLTATATTRADETQLTTPYPVSQLLFSDDTAVTARSFEIGQAYIFGYPYVTTPCFLARLDGPAPPRGSWPGGIGPDQSIVAFSAICSHKMSHPEKPISHIAYRPEAVSFYDSTRQKHTKKNIISCCSERSVYDPTAAGQVLSGPAPVPLAIIVLREDEQGMISATGGIGLNQYEQFLNKFGFRLAMEYGITDVRTRSSGTATAIEAEIFSAQRVLC